LIPMLLAYWRKLLHMGSSPAGVLGFVSGVRHCKEELTRAFFSSRFVRVLDSLGYARFGHWRLYGEEALAGREAGLWLAAQSLTVEHAGEPLSRYAVEMPRLSRLSRRFPKHGSSRWTHWARAGG
jgi:hypothetical protein